MKQSNVHFKYKMLHDSNLLTPVRCLSPLEYFLEAVKSQDYLGCKCLPCFPERNSHQNLGPRIPCLMHKKTGLSRDYLYAVNRKLLIVPTRKHCTMGCSLLWLGMVLPATLEAGSGTYLLLRTRAYLSHNWGALFSLRTKLHRGGVPMNSSG